MKLRIITGRAGAGKSKLVLETIAAQRLSAFLWDNLKKT